VCKVDGGGSVLLTFSTCVKAAPSDEMLTVKFFGKFGVWPNGLTTSDRGYSNRRSKCRT